MTDEIHDRRDDKWHVGKEVPIATILVLILQTCGVIWLAASTVAKVDFIKEATLANQIMQTAVDKRQDDDNRRSEDRVLTELRTIKAQLDALILRVPQK